MTRPLLLGAAAAALTAAAGFGASSVVGFANAANHASPNACKVLTLGIARSVIGHQTMFTAKAQPNPRVSQCRYNNKAKGAALNAEVGDWTTINLFGQGSPGNPAHKVKGVGDQAYVTKSGFVARKGNVGIDVLAITASGSFNGGSADTQEKRDEAAEKRAAKKMVAKLK